MIFFLFIFIIAAILLVKSASWVINGLRRIAHILGWSEFIVAFFLMALATSLPELFVGVAAAFHKNPALSFGNVLGANVINLTLGIGIAALVGCGIKLKKSAAKKEALFTVLFAALPVLMILDNSLSRLDGVILLCALSVYLSFLFKQRKRQKEPFEPEEKITEPKAVLKDFFILFLGLALLVGSAELAVWSASSFGEEIGAPAIVIGVLMVALGTTLPETAFSIRASLKKHQDMALGNLMGSVVINSSLVLGVVSIISPLKINYFPPYFIATFWIIMTSILFLLFSKSHNKITRKEAVFLLFVYLCFIIAQIISS